MAEAVNIIPTPSSGSGNSVITQHYKQVMTTASNELLKSAKNIGRQTASLFLGAVAFAVAIAWNGAVQSIIVLWTPKDSSKSTQQTAVRYNLIAASTLTLIAVAIAALLTWIYGKDVQNGQAKMYGLG